MSFILGENQAPSSNASETLQTRLRLKQFIFYLITLLNLTAFFCIFPGSGPLSWKG